MPPGRHVSESPPASLTPAEGWHCLHVFYRFDRQRLREMDEARLRVAADRLAAFLDTPAEHGLQRMQVSIVSGHKADFGLMMMDPDPLRLDAVLQSLAASDLGPALAATYSFVSMSEISEYVPTLEEYAARLRADGTEPGSPMYEAKLKAYEDRQPFMKKQRLTPDFPDWPATCFYPMNKKRKVGENWFTLSKAERSELMAEHAKSGMAFAGKVSQLITVSVGLDDWEWGVTLWAKNPEYLKDIVYQMRFDEASARYAEFGSFYTSYICSARTMLEHCQLAGRGQQVEDHELAMKS